MIETTESVGVRVARGLREAGVGHVFGVPGGQTLPLYGGILETPGIEHVLMRDERGAACAADAYSRITGRVGVCDATVGPGATNLVSGIAEAYGSSVAVLAIIADIPRGWEHRRARGNASQALDQATMFAGISKWVARVTSADALDDCLRVALTVATSGRPGPVVLSIADDVFGGPAGESAPAIAPVHAPRERFGPDPVRVAAAVRALTVSRRAILVAGGGAVASGAFDGVRALAELLECPVVTTMSGQGALEENHRLSLGVCGSMGNPIANAAIADADTVVYIGCKAGQAATLNYTTPAAGTTVIQVEIDPEEIGRNYPDTIALVGDARCALDDLMAELRACRWAQDGVGRRPIAAPRWRPGCRSRPRRRSPHPRPGCGRSGSPRRWPPTPPTRMRWCRTRAWWRDGRPTTSRSSGPAATRWLRAAWRGSAGVPRRRWELRSPGAKPVCQGARCCSPGTARLPTRSASWR